MQIFKKSKADDMQRLRAAGFSLANADRLSQDRRSGALILAVAGGIGLLMVGGIAAFGLQSTDNPQIATPTPAPQINVAKPAPEKLPIEKAVDAALLKVQKDAEDALVAAALAQNAITTQAPATSPVSASQSTGTDASAPRTLASGTATSDIATPAATPDCVAQLDSYLSRLIVQFGIGTTFITEQSDAKLADIGRRIAACDEAYVMVSGHADSTGDDATNIALSWARADKTVDRLTAYGADPTALEPLGFGARAPISQGSASDDPENRRVEFRVLRKKDPA